MRKVLRDHISSIRAFAYILHDQDEAVPHYHVLIRLHSAWSPTQIAKWFMNLTDSDKKPINTLAEVCHDMEAQKEYIMHNDPKSREEGKHQYSPTDLKEYGFHDLAERKDCYDNSYDILEKLLNGASMRDLVRYYGRDFLYHYNHYIEVSNLVRLQDVWKHNENPLDANMTRFALEESNLQEFDSMEVFEK